MLKEKKYTLETLLPLNVSYDSDHGLTQEDVDMVNDYVDLIERTHLETKPQVGDRLIYVDKYGRYFLAKSYEKSLSKHRLLTHRSKIISYDVSLANYRATIHHTNGHHPIQDNPYIQFLVNNKCYSDSPKSFVHYSLLRMPCYIPLDSSVLK